MLDATVSDHLSIGGTNPRTNAATDCVCSVTSVAAVCWELIVSPSAWESIDKVIESLSLCGESLLPIVSDRSRLTASARILVSGILEGSCETR